MGTPQTADPHTRLEDPEADGVAPPPYAGAGTTCTRHGRACIEARGSPPRTGLRSADVRTREGTESAAIVAVEGSLDPLSDRRTLP
jgi:hypothetical protein